MRLRLRSALVALAALLAASSSIAEPIGRHFELTPFAGFTIFDADMRYPGANSLTDDIYVGGRLGWQYNSWFGLELAAGFVPTTEDAVSNPADLDFWHVSGDIVASPWAGRWGGPYLLAGFGQGRLKGTSGGVTPTSGEFAGLDEVPMGLVSVGAGVRLWMTDAIGLRFEARDLYWWRDETSKPSYNQLVLGAGLSFALGATARDSDADGVPDKKDQCPDTPKGAKVDPNGCPIDTDGDKVFDGLDACPNTPAGCTVDAKGCESDSDGDGVCDGIDECADTPKGATVNARGCPSDLDGDKVLDGLDKCPGTPAGATVDANGCPTDADGDGVFDGLDKCPDTPAGLKVDADGCPIEINEKETELLDTGMIRLHDVNFETAKADLLPESFATLDAVGSLLLRWPQLQIEIGGHTDSRGSVKYNQTLSEARAQSVFNYVVGKFPAFKANQFTAKGYGEGSPMAPNNNDLNMAKNRRVEFVVQNKDVLKKEVEKRRLLKQGEGGVQPIPAAPDTTKK
jgi:OOP family OmpA-OmpF porin